MRIKLDECRLYSNEARIIEEIVKDPTATIRSISLACDLTSRYVQDVVRELEFENIIIPFLPESTKSESGFGRNVFRDVDADQLCQKDGWHYFLFSNLGLLLILMLENKDVKQRDMAKILDITERAVNQGISFLNKCGFIDIVKKGRRATYIIHRDRVIKTLYKECPSLTFLCDSQF